MVCTAKSVRVLQTLAVALLRPSVCDQDAWPASVRVPVTSLELTKRTRNANAILGNTTGILSSELPCDLYRQPLVTFGVDLGCAGLGVSQDNLSPFESILPPYHGAHAVT